MSSPSSTRSARPSFAAQCDGPLPPDLRCDADSMSADAFHAMYSPSSGPLRLGHWQCADSKGPSARLGTRRYQATIAVGDCIGTSTAAACGPVAALTAMLHERGVAVEMLNFHQRQAGGDTATFIQGSDGSRATWAMGLSDDPTQSALRALVACANRLSALPQPT